MLPPGKARTPTRSAPYERVKHHLKAGLASGVWPAGALMPSEAELVAEFGVSRMTVNRALRELQAEGLVERNQGVGTFAAELHKVSSTLKLRDLQEEIIARGHQHQAIVHLQQRETAQHALASQLGVPAGSQVFRTLIVHLEDGMPLQCEDRYVNPAAAPAYLDHDFTRHTPTHVLFKTTALWRAQFKLEAGFATPQEARLLGIQPTTPCLIVVRRTFTRHEVITLARLVHPGERYSLQGEFEP